MKTMHLSHIHSYGASIFVDIVVFVSKPIIDDNPLKIYFESICLVFLYWKQDFCIFCCIPSIMHGRGVISVTYNTLLYLKEGDLSPHTSQKIYLPCACFTMIEDALCVTRKIKRLNISLQIYSRFCDFLVKQLVDDLHFCQDVGLPETP